MSLHELLTDRTSRSHRHAVLGGYALAITLCVLSACGMARYRSSMDKALLTNSPSCLCNGTTLECTDQDGVTSSSPGANWCNQQYLNDAGVCFCTGTTLNCTASVCAMSVENVSAICTGNTTEQVAVLCDVNGIPKEDTSAYDGLPVQVGAPLDLVFDNSSQCSNAGVPPPPQPTSAPSGGLLVMQAPLPVPLNACSDKGGLSWEGDTCVCPGVIDHVLICADGTKFDNPTNQSCVPTESCSGGTTGGVTEEPVVCGCGQYGAPSTGLGCSNGVIEECNVSCGCKP